MAQAGVELQAILSTLAPLKILELDRDDGKENGDYYIMLCYTWECIGVILRFIPDPQKRVK